MSRTLALTTEQFAKALSRLIEMVLLGKAHIKIGRGLGRAIGEDPAIAQVAPAFWGMTINTHFDVGQLIAFKLFDPRHGTMTVDFLLKQAEKLKGSFGNATPSQVEAIIAVARYQIASLTDPLRKISAKRNRILAHADQMIASDPVKLTKEVELTFSDLNLVFTIAGSILNEISVGFRDTSPDYDMLNADDYEMVVQLVREAKCAQIRAYEAEFGPWDHLRPKNCP